MMSKRWLIPIFTGLMVGSTIAFRASAQSPHYPNTQEGSTPELQLAISEFQAAWQVEWRLSEVYRRGRLPATSRRRRHNYHHCHADIWNDRPGRIALLMSNVFAPPEAHYRMFQANSSGFGVCPSWLLTPVPHAQDQSRWRDAALLPGNRGAVQKVRAELIDMIRPAFDSNPANAWVAGQLTRFLVDARDFASAHDVARRCRADGWWCTALTGLVFSVQGALYAAESSFVRMNDLMPDSVRCRWTDMSELLVQEAKRSYQGAACTTLRELDARIWWLADPLYRDGVNDRLVEQETRRMGIALREATIQDELYPFVTSLGGDAVATVLQRYGWPTYTAWGGWEQDRSHDLYLQRNLDSPIVPPYTTFEYSLGRITTIPSWTAVTDPFKARSTDWFLALEDEKGHLDNGWWPEELFLPRRRLVQLPDPQVVSLRRQSHVEVVASQALDHPVLRSPDTYFDVMLLSTTGPGKVDSIARGDAAGGFHLVLRGNVKHSPALLAIEALGPDSASADARTRFGYAAPAPLSASEPGAVAVSDIAIIQSLTDEQLRAPDDRLLQHMLPSTRLPASVRRIAIYWESYGTTPIDSATITLRIAGDESLGLLRRAGIAAGIATDPNSNIQIRWSDSDQPGNVSTLLGPVPVQIRSLALDLKALRVGKYTIEVTITLRDGRTSTAQTHIELMP